jgi:hypothetical protein
VFLRFYRRALRGRLCTSRTFNRRQIRDPRTGCFAKPFRIERAYAQLTDALLSDQTRVDQNIPVMTQEREAHVEPFRELGPAQASVRGERIDDLESMWIGKGSENFGALLCSEAS